jgi:hypothetical protein
MFDFPDLWIPKAPKLKDRFGQDLRGYGIWGLGRRCCEEVSDCELCSTFPDQFQVVIADLVDGTCSQCDSALNGTFTLNWFSGCEWRYTLYGVCSDTWILRLFFSGTTITVIWWSVSVIASEITWTETLGAGPHDCDAISGLAVDDSLTHTTGLCDITTPPTCTVTAL